MLEIKMNSNVMDKWRVSIIDRMPYQTSSNRLAYQSVNFNMYSKINCNLGPYKLIKISYNLAKLVTF